VDRVLFAPRTLTALRADVAEDPIAYDTWVRQRVGERLRGGQAPPQTLSLHVVMVIDGAPPSETTESLVSLGAQTSTQWKLTVVAPQPWRTEVTSLMTGSGIRRPMQLVERPADTDPGDMLVAGLLAAGSDDVALLFPGDVWSPDAVSILSSSLFPESLVYADEDSIDTDGRHFSPRLKPDFSPEFLLHSNYMGRPLAISAGVVQRLPAAEARTSATREHDLALRACGVASAVRHVPEVLCHRRIAPGRATTDAATDVGHILKELDRQTTSAEVTPGRVAGTFHIRRPMRSLRTASVIIPFRDEPRYLRACIDSIDRTKGGIHHQYILVDNGSVQPETTTLLERLVVRPDVAVVHDDRPFNWAALNNAAAASAEGDALVFLNNDIEALSEGWLDALCAQLEQADVGAVGARLLYPDHRVQHCGVVIGLGGAAGHLLVGLDEAAPGYLDLAVTTRECSGVTGACMATRRDTFEKLGGFDESLGIDLNDIDYCLRLQRAGLRVLYEPGAELIHYESPSRGTVGDVGNIVRFIERWETNIAAGDRFLNPHLTRRDSSCALRDPGEDEWWQRWYRGLSDM
jgi:GT2 family glycosyltransferase